MVTTPVSTDCSAHWLSIDVCLIASFLSNHYSLIVTSAHHYTSYWSSHSLAPGSRGRTELNAQCHAKTCPWLSCFSTNLNFYVYIKGLGRIQYHKPLQVQGMVMSAINTMGQRCEARPMKGVWSSKLITKSIYQRWSSQKYQRQSLQSPSQR